MMDAGGAPARLATRLSFFVAGFGIACWGSLVPFAKERLGVDEAVLGVLLLCLGLGSVAAMVAAGSLIGQFGSKRFVAGSGVALAVLLPTLALADAPVTLGALLLAFGASLGTLEVAMNVHAVDVERAAGQALMSGFHAMYSVGGFIGAGLMALLLSASGSARWSSLVCAALALSCMAAAIPRLIASRPAEKSPLFAIPHGVVVLLACLCAITFLIEGALLDWSALLLVGGGLTDAERGGIGYMVFAAAMTTGRLGGDWIVARFGRFRLLVIGGIVAVVGLVILVVAPDLPIALAGFLLLGLGASNTAPSLFSIAGSQRIMPVGLAVSALATTGYAGVLLGPAAIGFCARAIGLPDTFILLALLMAIIPLTARFATAGTN